MSSRWPSLRHLWGDAQSGLRPLFSPSWVRPAPSSAVELSSSCSWGVSHGSGVRSAAAPSPAGRRLVIVPRAPFAEPQEGAFTKPGVVVVTG